MQHLVDRFIKGYDQTFKIQMGQPKSVAMLQSRGASESMGRNHAMRFSFEKIISDNNNNNKRISANAMNPLMEVDEEEGENEYVEPPRQEHGAFRDLFPDGEEAEQLNTDIYSPTFKNI